MPEYDFAQYRMGCIYSYAERDFKTATKYFKKAYALGMGETDSNIYYDIGRNYLAMKKYSLALKYVEEGQKLYPQSLDLISIKIGVLYRQRKYAKVSALMKEVLEKYPDDIWVQQGNAMILSKFKQYDEAIKYLEPIRKNLPEINVFALAVLAGCYFEKKEYEKSLETFLEYSQKEDLRDLEKQDIRKIKSFIKMLYKYFPNDDRLKQIEENFKPVI